MLQRPKWISSIYDLPHLSVVLLSLSLGASFFVGRKTPPVFYKAELVAVTISSQDGALITKGASTVYVSSGDEEGKGLLKVRWMMK